jgi:hypothetical protein
MMMMLPLLSDGADAADDESKGRRHHEVETRKHRLVVILIVIFGCNKRRHGGPGRIGKELVPSVLECESLWVSFGIISRKIKKGAHMGYFWYYKY